MTQTQTLHNICLHIYIYTYLQKFHESSLHQQYFPKKPASGGVLAGTSGGTTEEFPGCTGESQQGAGGLGLGGDKMTHIEISFEGDFRR